MVEVYFLLEKECSKYCKKDCTRTLFFTTK